MEWFEALILGLVQGLTEFLPVSSSGHLAIGKALLGVEPSGDLIFEVTVHAATVLATIVVFRKEIWKLLCGLFKFKYNDETDYIAKIVVSMIPVFVVGMFFKDQVEAAFNSMRVVGVCLLVTAVLLTLSDWLSARVRAAVKESRNGISFWQAFVVGVGQACAVLPGLSRSGTTISAGLLSGVKRESMAQFSFLMVLVPILGEAFLDVVDTPIAIRSSSLLEDSHYQPFAGIYSTYMIPHVDDKYERLHMLSDAIKAVYASVYYRDSKAYMTATSNVIDQE